MDNEEWRPVVGYEGLYEVSNMGRVRSLERTVSVDRKTLSHLFYRPCPEIILKQSIVQGYKVVGLSKEKIRKQVKVHRLVAEAFIPNPNNKPVVNHLDEDKTNNCVENLEWCTTFENLHYGTAIERKKRTLRRKWANGEVTQKPSREWRNAREFGQYSMDGKLIKTFGSLAEARESLGLRGWGSHISSCLHGGRDKAYGYRWRYLDG